MDEVLAKFASAFGQDPKEESRNNYENLYKNWGKFGNQEERRREILERQKNSRNSKLDRFRGILELVHAVEDRQIFRPQNKAFYRPSIYVAGFHKVSPTYSNVLMMSEWMVEKPKDFHDNWYLVPCPKGIRMLVVATRGSTKCYTKYGHFKFEVFTALPGGHLPKKNNDQCCILDCFYSEVLNTMFVVDLLAWNLQPMTDGETDFRYYWLKAHLEELTDLNSISKKNEVIFKLLPKIPCDPVSFHHFMNMFPPFENNCPALDGLLFYHKRAHYIAGQTPLVGWLYPFMVPEIIGPEMEINRIYLLEKPESYVNQADFIDKFEAKQVKKYKRIQKASYNAMETDNIRKIEVRPKKKTDSKQSTEKMEAEESEKKDSQTLADTGVEDIAETKVEKGEE